MRHCSSLSMKRWIKPCAQAGPSYSQLASAPHRTNTSATLHFATSSCAYAVPMCGPIREETLTSLENPLCRPQRRPPMGNGSGPASIDLQEKRTRRGYRERPEQTAAVGHLRADVCARNGRSCPGGTCTCRGPGDRRPAAACGRSPRRRARRRLRYRSCVHRKH
ncbi:hypothetical protein RPHASCH2410_CH01545 [Rhizobium phaseoli Ch24-10]|nr:hypothetical protein RPHASCH2410_CH01545 [Rhizobium phaseoli Ch24-10]